VRVVFQVVLCVRYAETAVRFHYKTFFRFLSSEMDESEQQRYPDPELVNGKLNLLSLFICARNLGCAPPFVWEMLGYSAST